MSKNKYNPRVQAINGISEYDGAVIGVRGYLQGRMFGLRPGVPLVIGRDPQYCNLVIMKDTISRIHCTIDYQPSMKMYVIQDNSTNGVLIENGKWMNRGDTIMVPGGTHIAIGTQEDELLLR